MIYNVDPRDLIEATAEELKKLDHMAPPEWAGFVKTGSGKDKQPMREDWWYIRAAAILRFVFKNGPIGTGKLRVHFGGKANRGYQPDKFQVAAGNHIRKILQQLEAEKLIVQEQKEAYKGRIATGKGIALLNKVAKSLDKKGGN